MKCNNCKKDLTGIEKYCPNCGAMVNTPINIGSDRQSTENYRVASIILGGLSVGGVLLFIFAPVSLILSIIGLILAIKSNKNSKNVAGLVLNGIGLFLSFIITAFIALLFRLTVDVINEGIDGINIHDYIEEQRTVYEEDRF